VNTLHATKKASQSLFHPIEIDTVNPTIDHTLFWVVKNGKAVNQCSVAQLHAVCRAKSLRMDINARVEIESEGVDVGEVEIAVLYNADGSEDCQIWRQHQDYVADLFGAVADMGTDDMLCSESERWG